MFRWSGPTSYLHVPAEAKGFEMGVRSSAPMPQTLTVEVRGKVIDTQKLTDQEWHTISYQLDPAATNGKPDSQWVVLKIDPMWKPPRDGRQLGVMTRDLKWR